MPIVAQLLKYLFTLQMIQGYRAYLAAAGSLGIAVYYLSQGEYDKAVAGFIAFVGLLSTKPGDPPAPPPAPLKLPIVGRVAALLAVGLVALPATAQPDRGPVHTTPTTKLGDRGPIWQLPPQPAEARRVVPDPGKTPWHVTQVEADKCWAKGATGKGVLVAVLDTGCDLGHPFFAGKLAGAVDLTNSPIGANDRNQHGTHTAGTVLQVSPEAKVFVVKVLGDNGSGFDDDIGKGIDLAVAKGKELGLRTVVSMSLGSNQRGPYSGPAVARALAAGATVVAAAGNSGEGGIGFPGAEPGVVCVAAVDAQSRIASFSSRGMRVDVAAGGVEVPAPMPGGGYQTMSGTSMATPVVSGCAALVLGESGLHAQPVREAFIETAKDLPPAGRDRNTGYGLVQPLKLIAGDTPNPPNPPTPPTPPTPLPGNLVITAADLNDAGKAKLKAAGLKDFSIDLTWLKAFVAQLSQPVPAPAPQPAPVFGPVFGPVYPPFPGGCPGGNCPRR